MKAKEFVNELGKSQTYARPLGMMELVKFNEIASAEQKKLMWQLSHSQDPKDHARAWQLLQDVTKVKLS